MMDHSGIWLQAYHDGELTEQQARRVEAHVEQCAACRAELETLRDLSLWLAAAPSANGLPSAERFVAELGLKLPRRPDQTLTQRALMTGWKMIPVGLVVAWAFFQAVSLMSYGLTFALSFGEGLIGGSFVPWGGIAGLDDWVSGMSELDAQSIYAQALRVLPFEITLDWSTMLGLAVSVVMALAIWSWLASFWIRYQRRSEA